MTSDAVSQAEGDLFKAEDYTTWCRSLYQALPRDGAAHVLFESTIAEPTDLLRKVATRVFGDTMSDRFVSVFGNGNGFLIDALAARYGVGADQVVCSTGAANAITMVLRALPREKRHVVVETPRLDLLHHLPRAFGLEVSDVRRTGEAFDIDPDEFRRALRFDTGLVILSNPHNPSGRLLPPDRLIALAKIAGEVGALILIDEVYSDLARDNGFSSEVHLASNIATVNSLTKSYGLFSLRCGWLLARPALARQVEAANARVEFGASKLAHAVAAHVLEDPAPFDRYWREVLGRNRPVMEKHAAAMKRDGLVIGDLASSGCMYFPRVVDFTDTASLARRLWQEQRVLVAPGEFFGRSGHIRLGFGMVDGRLEVGLMKLHETLLQMRRENRGRSPNRAAGVSR